MRKKKRLKGSKKKISFFYKYKKVIIISSLVALFVISGIYALQQMSDKNCIIMITDSRACHCVKNRCVSLKNQISDMLRLNFNNSVRFKVIEYWNKKRSEKIMNKYGMGMIPAVVIVNKNGEAIYNSSFYNFNIEEFKNKIYELKGQKK
jgi:hypothetical protein